MTLKALTLAAVAIGAAALHAGNAGERTRAAAPAPDRVADRAAGTADTEALAAEAGALAKGYGGTLLAAVKSALETSGPVGAIAFCHDEAPGMAAEQSRRSGWRIARTSLKPRNPNAAPDDYERRVLEEFSRKIAAGAPVAGLSHAEIVETDGGRVFRFMAAIPTAAPCLTCHGSSLKPEVAAKIRELYPADRATGFSEGDMRGAFTLSKPL